MQVTVLYHGQARAAAGVGSEQVEVGSGCTVGRLLEKLVARHGKGLGDLIQGPDGSAHRSVLLFVEEEQVRADSQRPLREGETVAMLLPISGG